MKTLILLTIHFVVLIFKLLKPGRSDFAPETLSIKISLLWHSAFFRVLSQIFICYGLC